MSAWRPIGTAAWRDDVRARVRTWMDALADATPALDADRAGEHELTLFSGRTGLALAHAWYAHVARDERHAELALARFDEVGAALGGAGLGPSLHSGFGGVGWLGRLLATLHGGDDPCADLDDALAADLAADDPDRDFDLVWGASGCGVYALGAASPANALAVVDYLERTARAQPRGGVAWFRPARLLHESRRRRYPDGLYDLGLAHGAAGVIAFLTRALAAGIAPARVRPLLEGACAWMWSLAGAGDGFAFPSLIGPTGDRFPSRFGWCYGDLGAAIALLGAAHALGDEAAAARALAIARASTRVPLDERTVGDPWLCHGAAGLAHMFDRLHQATGDRSFAGAAVAWIDRAAALMPSPPAAGGGWREELGLMDGFAGAALSCLAAVGDAPPIWDEVLLPAVI